MTKPLFPPPGDTESLEHGSVFTPRFDPDGLIPAIASDAETGEVVMFAWMNAEALKRTIDTGTAHYFSRSRRKLWMKGEESGNVQTIVEIRTDCDQDVVLLKVRTGGAGKNCHTGARSCFYRRLERDPSGTVGLSFTE